MCYRFCRRVFREIQSWTPVDKIIMRNLENTETNKRIEDTYLSYFLSYSSHNLIWYRPGQSNLDIGQFQTRYFM
jgi:hypothetical protein